MAVFRVSLPCGLGLCVSNMQLVERPVRGGYAAERPVLRVGAMLARLKRNNYLIGASGNVKKNGASTWGPLDDITKRDDERGLTMSVTKHRMSRSRRAETGCDSRDGARDRGYGRRVDANRPENKTELIRRHRQLADTLSRKK